MNKEIIIKTCSWVLGGVVALLAIAVWASQRLDGSSLTPYDMFPLLGLLAFSLMWTHYILGSLRRKLRLEANVNRAYFSLTSLAVFVLILLHPGILIIQLNKDGFGLPPDSYMKVYTLPAMRGAIMLGTIALIIFLAFEFKKKFKDKKWWKFVEYAQVLAMALIFYHGLTLGRELSVGWYKAVWYLYGVSLLTAVIYNYWYDRRGIRRNDGR